MDTLVQDVRLALRTLARNRTTTIVAILCLALGIGANAAIFSVVDAVLLRPLPYESSDRLVRVQETFNDGRGTGAVSYPNYRDWRAQARSFEQLAIYSQESRSLQGVADPERVQAVAGGDNLFAALRAHALIGRTFLPLEDRPDRARVAVLSEAFWRRRFGGDPSVLGKAIVLDAVPHTIVGVMPATFAFPPGGATTELYVPLTPDRELAEARGNHWFQVVARLAPGITLDAARGEMSAIAKGIAQAYPLEQQLRGAYVAELRESVVGNVRPALYVLLGAVALVLLVACANVANLLLARAAARRKDVAIRTALGATRARLVRQFLTESVVLALLGALLGALVARWALAALVSLAGRALPATQSPTLDASVFAYLLVVAIATGIAFGLVPALKSSRGDLRGDLTDASKGSAGVSHQRARSSLVVAEIALSLVLLVGAGLLMRAFLSLRGTEPGMRADHVLVFHVSAPPSQNEHGEAGVRLFRPILERLRALPAVQQAGATSVLPIENWGWNGDFHIEGRAEPAKGQAPFSEFRVITPGYLAALGVPLRRGRALTEDEGERGASAVMVNEALVKRYFADEEPLGRRILLGDDPATATRLTIVGVVANVRQAGLDREPLPEIYQSYADTNAMKGLRELTIAVRTRGAPELLTPAVRDVVRSVSADQPVYGVRTMDEVIARSLANRRLYLWLLGTFAVVALALASAGIYGVIAYVVAQRTREIGIRMALGAKQGDVVALVLRQGGALVLLGVAIGVVGALALTRVLASLLYGVSARDPLTFAFVAALLGGVALLATWIPARRASRVDPLSAIRSE